MNEYVWNLYLKSGGAEVVSFFEKSLTPTLTLEYGERIKKLHSVYAAYEGVVELVYEQLSNVIEYLKEEDSDVYGESVPEDEVDDAIHEWLEETWKAYFEQCKKDEKLTFDELSYNIAAISTIASIFYPDVFTPYYFLDNYNVLQMISSAFDIKIPETPKKKEYKARFMFYGDICRALYDFRRENHFTPYELYAFLYDFAPNYIGGKSSYIIEDLPAPKSAYFIGGHGKGSDLVAEEQDEITFWQCNPDTRVGDMIVMYLTSPVSSILSIWRSVSIGFNDPFFYYYRCTYIGNPTKGKRIGINDIKADPVLGEMPIVKGNMQGINGVELMPSEYNHIVDITGCKAPKLEYSAVGSEGEYPNEKAVEENVIKPFLKSIGYGEKDYVQQLYVEIGNHNNTLIPDFVLLPDDRGAYKRAFGIIEAKRSITKDKELKEALSQTRSYALLLRVKYAALASQEGIWILSDKDEYANIIKHYKWSETKDDDVLYELKKMLGKL